MATVREVLDRAYSLCDKGEWDESLGILSIILGFTRAELAEIVSLQGRNNWEKGEKEKAYLFWSNVAFIRPGEATAVIKASVHAGLSMYYAEKGERAEALRNAQIALDLFSTDATLDQMMILKVCGITLAKAGEFEYAEKVLRRVAEISRQFEKSDDPVIVRKAISHRAGSGCSLVSLVLTPQKRWDDALYELLQEVIPRYVKTVDETNLAAADHQLSKAWRGKGNLSAALGAEKNSRLLWERYDVPDKIEAANRNIAAIEKEMREKAIMRAGK